MSYQISDTGASLRFISEAGFFFLMKHHIKSIQYIRENTIRINTGCCMHSIYLDADHVTLPVNDGAEHLVQLLNHWITIFLQGYEPVVEPPGER